MLKHLFCSFLLGIALLLSFTINAQNWVNGGNALAANGILGTNSNHSLIFRTNGVERGRITNTGNWGIGTSSPVGKFHVIGMGTFGSLATPSNATRVLNLVDGNAVMRIVRVHPSFAPAVELLSRTSADGSNVAYWDFYAEPSDKSFRIRDRVGGGSGLDRVTVSSTGNVGIGTTTPSNKLDVVGRGQFSQGLSAFSGGIYAVHNTGNGVEGYGQIYGLYGKGSNMGVYGTGDNMGVYGSGGQQGVYGIGGYYGVSGVSTLNDMDAIGIAGRSDYGTGCLATGGWQGVYGGGTVYGVYGVSPSGIGVFGTTASSTSYAGYFQGNVYTTGLYLSSDQKLKKNIYEITNALDLIAKLKPKTYEYRQEGSFRLMNLPQGKQYGLLAQDMEQVLPNLVKQSHINTSDLQLMEQKSGMKPDTGHKEEKENTPAPPVIKRQKGEIVDFKAVNYIELIPIMIKGMQEQQAIIKKQQQQNEELVARIEKLEGIINELSNRPITSNATVDGTLLQNTPNPVRGATAIGYSLPEGAGRATLLLTDALGRTIRVVQLTSSGIVSIDVSTLGSGVYNYSLVVDGRILQTKKMTVKR